MAVPDESVSALQREMTELKSRVSELSLEKEDLSRECIRLGRFRTGGECEEWLAAQRRRRDFARICDAHPIEAATPALRRDAAADSADSAAQPRARCYLVGVRRASTCAHSGDAGVNQPAT